MKLTRPTKEWLIFLLAMLGVILFCAGAVKYINYKVQQDIDARVHFDDLKSCIKQSVRLKPTWICVTVPICDGAKHCDAYYVLTDPKDIK